MVELWKNIIFLDRMPALYFVMLNTFPFQNRVSECDLAQRVPYMLVIGKKEAEDGTIVTVRSRDKDDLDTYL